MYTKKMRHVILGLAVIMVMALFSSYCYAADDGVTIDFKDADIRSALETLFRGTGKSFVLGNDVGGTITISISQKQPFDNVLRAMLKANSLVWRVDNGIYTISRKLGTSTGTLPGSGITGASMMSPGTTTTPEATTKKESSIEKITLLHLGSSELIYYLNGGSSSNGGGSSSFGGNNSGGNNSSGGYGNSNRSSGGNNRSSSSGSSYGNSNSSSNRSSGGSSNRSW